MPHVSGMLCIIGLVRGRQSLFSPCCPTRTPFLKSPPSTKIVNPLATFTETTFHVGLRHDLRRSAEHEGSSPAEADDVTDARVRVIMTPPPVLVNLSHYDIYPELLLSLKYTPMDKYLDYNDSRI